MKRLLFYLLTIAMAITFAFNLTSCDLFDAFGSTTTTPGEDDSGVGDNQNNDQSHVHTYVSTVISPTCTEDGYTRYTCSCGNSYISDQTSKLGHSLVIDPAVSPTCTEKGLTEGSHCAICSTVITRQEIAPALGHTLVIDAAVSPTCTEEGLTEGSHCATCSIVITNQEIAPALGHTPVIDDAVPPACTEEGLTEGMHCETCSAIIIQQESILPIGHMFVLDPAVPPTCTENGLTEGSHCSECNFAVIEQQIIPMLGHTADSNEYKAPTCTESGWSSGTTCTTCGVEIQQESKIPALGHDYRAISSTPATCITSGSELMSCINCESTVLRKIDAIGHNISVYEVEALPTCESSGERAGYCDICLEYVTVFFPATGHIAKDFIYEDGYCGEQRLGYCTCTECGTVVLTFGHTYTTSITDATCTVNGAITHTCTNCNDSYSEMIESKGHILTAPVLTRASTCTSEGLETVSCMVCSEVIETYAIAKKDHQYYSTVSTGVITYTCQYCSDSYVVVTTEYVTVSFVTVLDGVDCAPIAVKEGGKADLPHPEKEGYSFNGWYLDEEFTEKCSADHIFKSDTILYAYWSVSTVEGSTSANNIVTDAPLDFTFVVESSTELTDANLYKYVSVEDSNGNSVALYISSVDGNLYTIASNHYQEGTGYEAVASNSVTLVGTNENHLLFVTRSENKASIVFKDGVVLISEDDIFTAYETDDGRIYFFFRSDILDVGDVAVIYRDDPTNVLVTLKVSAEGSAEGAYIYEVEPADSDEIFEECDMYFSGDIETGNLEFAVDLEEELIKQVEESAVYEQMRIASKQFAKGTVIGNYYYEFSDIKVTPNFHNDKEKDQITVSIKITSEFKRMHVDTREVQDILAITFELKSVFTLSSTVDFSSTNNFTLVLNVDNTTTAKLFVSMGKKDESKEELNYFKALFFKAKEEGSFNELDSSTASSEKETTIGRIPFTFCGITFSIDFANVFSFEMVGELGICAEVKMETSIGIQCRGGDLSTVRSFDSNATLDFYMMGKIRVSDTIRIRANVSLLGIVNAYIDLQAGPYFEIGGAAIISLSSGGGYSANIGGYIEMGITVKATAGANAKITFWCFGTRTLTLFDKNWTIYKQDFVIFKIGSHIMTLYFADTEESIDIDYTCGDTIYLSDVVNTTVVQQNLKTMKKENKDMTCTYSLETDTPYVTVSKDGKLSIKVGSLENLEITVKVSYGDVYKIVTLVIDIKHDIVVEESVAPTCTVTGLTEGKYCANCNDATIAQEIVPALGHNEISHDAKASTCTEFGWDAYVTCSRCDYSTYSERNATGHTYESLVTLPTVSAEGYTTYTCHCGDSYISDYTTPISASEGIEYVLSDDGTYYIVKGIGTCTDENIVIMDMYKSVPVTHIAEAAFHRNTSIVSIAIPNSVTTIGDSAFNNCVNLTSVVIPDSVTEIGASAFCNCRNLTSVTIGNGVTSIGDYTFYNCYNLTSVVIPDSVTTIGSSAFYGCSKLTSVIIPDSVTEIGSDAFYDCSMLNAVYITDIATWCNISFANYYANPLYYAHNLYLNGELITELVIPNGVTTIPDYAFFDLNSITSIVIPNSVTSFGSYAFYGCSKLSNVYIADIATWCNISFYNYSSNPFYYANNLYLNGELITELAIPNGVITIPDYAFYNLNSITSIVIPNSVTEIGPYAFYDLDSIVSIVIPNSVTKIGSSAFYSCFKLASVMIGNGVTEIGEYAFKNCSNLTSVVIGDSVTEIGNSAFNSCYKLTSVVIPDSVTEIGDDAFNSCSKLTSVTIGNGVISIGSNAFYCCNSALYTKYEYGNYIGDANNPYAVLIELTNNNFTTYTIHDDTKYIAYGVFKECAKLTKITIPDGVRSIGFDAFYGCSNLSVVYITDIADWCNISFDGSDANPLYYAHKLCLNGELITELAIPDGVTTIPDYAFCDLNNIKSIVIPNSVTNIGARAFYSCDNLTSVTIGNGVTKIGASAFYNCYNLTSVIIPDSITEIGSYAFRDCDSLTSVTIGNGVTKIGSDAFRDCDNLTSVVIGDSVIEIGDYAFGRCSNLTSVIIPDSVTEIGSYAFWYCSNLTSVVIGDSVTLIDNHAFAACSNLTRVVVGNSVTEIRELAFYDCDMLTDVYITDIAAWCEITFIYGSSYGSSNPMYYAKNLYLNDELITELVIPDGVTTIPDFAFYRQSSITSVIIPDSITEIGSYAFGGCSKLVYNEYDNVYYLGNDVNPFLALIKTKSQDITSCLINENTKVIAGSAFKYCSNLTSVVIPDSVTSIGSDAFYECYFTDVHITNISAWCNISFANSYSNPILYTENLYLNGELITRLVIHDGVTTILDYAFYNLNSITSIVIPNSVTTISYSAFKYCSNLTSVVIPDSVTTIGAAAFESCSNLTSVVIGDSVTEIGSGAFYNCKSLTNIEFNGTIAEWNAIEKADNWDYNTPSYTIYCTDGEITKDGTVTYY